MNQLEKKLTNETRDSLRIEKLETQLDCVDEVAEQEKALEKAQSLFEEDATGKKLVTAIQQNRKSFYALLLIMQKDGTLTRSQIDNVLGDDKSRRLYTQIRNELGLGLKKKKKKRKKTKKKVKSKK